MFMLQSVFFQFTDAVKNAATDQTIENHTRLRVSHIVMSVTIKTSPELSATTFMRTDVTFLTYLFFHRFA